jgi:hypothetical protein
VSRIHVLARDNGAGLSRDLVIVTQALAQAGHEVCVSGIGAGGMRRAWRLAQRRATLAWRGWREGAAASRFDLNLMLERIRPEYFALARRNVLVPNPEWFDDEDRRWLGGVDAVFTKTRHAAPLFEALGCRSVHTGFTSLDRLRAEVPREPAFFHLGGRSVNKGSQALLDLWLRKPHWPALTMVQRATLAMPAQLPANIRLLDGYLDDDDLRVLQNRHRFHLCPSETEGFGHHLVEGMSVGAIVLATDAPPMNELVGAERGVLVAPNRSGTQRLATTWFVDPAALEAAVERMLAFDESACTAIGARARAWWESNDRAFREHLASAITSVLL